jgi:hypothetical protein
MIPSISNSPRFAPNPWNKALDLFILTVLFCALMAAIMTAGAPSFAAFGRWLLIVESVGLAAATIGTVFARLPWLRRHTPTVAHLIIILVAIPSGYVVGSSFAYTLLDEPWPIFDPGPRRFIALIASALAAAFIVYLDAMRSASRWNLSCASCARSSNRTCSSTRSRTCARSLKRTRSSRKR